MVAASALMVTPAHRFVKRLPILIHIVGKASCPSTLGTHMPTAPVFVFFQLICYISLYYSFWTLVSPCAPPLYPCTEWDGWNGRDTLGQYPDWGFARLGFCLRLYSALFSWIEWFIKVFWAGVPYCPTRSELSPVSSLPIGEKSETPGHPAYHGLQYLLTVVLEIPSFLPISR